MTNFKLGRVCENKESRWVVPFEVMWESIMNESCNPRERRRYRRIKVDYMALLSFCEDGMQGQDKASGRVRDISPGGVRVEVDSVLQVGTVIRMRIATWDSLLDVDGRVVYCTPGCEKGQVLGIQYTAVVNDLGVEA